MSDQDDRRDDPRDEPTLDERAFDDPAHAELRRLLADARVSEPVPADVAARLDATLASLRQERPAVADVVPLRRRLGRVLVAAAAVVVVGSGGVGIAQLARDGSAGDDSATSGSAVAADRDSSARESDAPKAASPEDAPNVAGLAAGALPRLTTARFGQDVARVMLTTYDVTASPIPTPAQTRSENLQDFVGTPGPAPSAPPVTSSPTSAADGGAGQAATCAGPAAPDAIILPARLDGTLVALVFRPPTADAQVVEAWSCDGAALLVSATVPH